MATPAAALTRKGAATRARILAAATAEFAEHGLAGARVDRIAAQAGANKQLIYEHFGSKDGLFDATIEASTAVLQERLVIDPTDPVGHAVALYDFMLEHPEIDRLFRWHALQRPGVAGALPALGANNEPLLAGYAAAQAAGRITSRLSPEMLLVFVFSMVQSTEDEQLVHGGGLVDPAVKREALRVAVEQLCRV